jgi:hypothetical protein
MFLQLQKYDSGMLQACIIGANPCILCSNEFIINKLLYETCKTGINQDN